MVDFHPRGELWRSRQARAMSIPALNAGRSTPAMPTWRPCWTCRPPRCAPPLRNRRRFVVRCPPMPPAPGMRSLSSSTWATPLAATHPHQQPGRHRQPRLPAASTCPTARTSASRLVDPGAPGAVRRQAAHRCGGGLRAAPAGRCDASTSARRRRRRPVRGAPVAARRPAPSTLVTGHRGARSTCSRGCRSMVRRSGLRHRHGARRATRLLEHGDRALVRITTPPARCPGETSAHLDFPPASAARICWSIATCGAGSAPGAWAPMATDDPGRRIVLPILDGLRPPSAHTALRRLGKTINYNAPTAKGWRSADRAGGPLMARHRSVGDHLERLPIVARDRPPARRISRVALAGEGGVASDIGAVVLPDAAWSRRPAARCPTPWPNARPGRRRLCCVPARRRRIVSVRAPRSALPADVPGIRRRWPGAAAGIDRLTDAEFAPFVERFAGSVGRGLSGRLGPCRGTIGTTLLSCPASAPEGLLAQRRQLVADARGLSNSGSSRGRASAFEQLDALGGSFSLIASTRQWPRWPSGRPSRSSR